MSEIIYGLHGCFCIDDYGNVDYTKYEEENEKSEISADSIQ